jgi:hypothetical protein
MAFGPTSTAAAVQQRLLQCRQPGLARQDLLLVDPQHDTAVLQRRDDRCHEGRVAAVVADEDLLSAHVRRLRGPFRKPLPWGQIIAVGRDSRT